MLVVCSLGSALSVLKVLSGNPLMSNADVEKDSLLELRLASQLADTWLLPGILHLTCNCMCTCRGWCEAKEMEAAGLVAPGSLKEARKLSRFFKYEPLKFIQAVCNAVQQGSGISLDQFLPHASPPAQPGLRDLESKGACVFLGDQEKKQRLAGKSNNAHK